MINEIKYTKLNAKTGNVQNKTFKHNGEKGTIVETAQKVFNANFKIGKNANVATAIVGDFGLEVITIYLNQ